MSARRTGEKVPRWLSETTKQGKVLYLGRRPHYTSHERGRSRHTLRLISTQNQSSTLLTKHISPIFGKKA
ncbi:hypothetical protein [Pontibacter sp. HSC-36F09]|uniref:hypothetical protein n=1 Tax=Pontibacter sp. HSC-36F09 TaxID=2910966 RepID=UPI0020A0022F|nr:hypothetical protein [Pontibacter sp. HSC-36F09]MCP2044059.1 hypothetical protein [Pontibacter sp. HSC-36F09]